MTQMGSYGQRLGQRLRVKDAPALITRVAAASSEVAVTETRNDEPRRIFPARCFPRMPISRQP